MLPQPSPARPVFPFSKAKVSWLHFLSFVEFLHLQPLAVNNYIELIRLDTRNDFFDNFQIAVVSAEKLGMECLNGRRTIEQLHIGVIL